MALIGPPPALPGKSTRPRPWNRSPSSVATDRLVFDLWLAGHALRAIAAHPHMRLSLAVVQQVLRRECIQMDVGELLESEYAAACRAVRAGDIGAAWRCRRIAARLTACPT